MCKPYHPCRQCGKGVRFNGGAFCRSCLRTIDNSPLPVGSIGQQIAAARASKLMTMVAQTNDSQVLANVAADQLARAWGVERKRV